MTGSSEPLHLEALLAHEHSLKSLARELLRDEHAAEDLAQQALLRGIERPPVQPASLSSYLARIVRNTALDLGRVSRRRLLREQAAAQREALPSAADMAEREQLRRTVAEAVLALEEPYRTSVWLRFYEDLAPRAIARRMSVPVNTVRTRLHRALDQLRSSLDERHGGKRDSWRLLMAPIAGLKMPSVLRVPGAIVGALLMKKASVVVVVAAAVLVTLATVLLWFDHTSQATRDETVGAAQPASGRAVESASPGERREDVAGPVRAPALAALPAWRIEGLVRKPSGTPVPGAHVAVTAKQRFTIEGEIGRTRADAGGHYVMDLTAWRERSPLDLRVIFLDVEAWAPAHLPGTPQAPAHLPGTTPQAPASMPAATGSVSLSFPEVGPDQEMVLRCCDVFLPPGGLLTGRVVDAYGTPAKGAFVRLYAEGKRQELGSASTDLSGEYRLGITDDGPHVLVGSRGDLGWVEERLFLRKGQDHTAPDFVLRPTTRLRGVVVFADGQPIADLAVTVVTAGPGAQITAGEERRTPYVRGATCAMRRTAADGSFEFRGLLPGKYHLWLPAHLWEDADRPGGDTTARRFSRLVDTEDAETRIVLDLHRFRLRFRDEAGRQLVASDMVCEGWKPNRAEAIERLAAGTLPVAEADAWPKVGIHGSDDDLLVPRGSWWCFATGLRGRHRGEASVRAPDHPNESEVLITLREIRTTATLRIHVVSPQREPVAQFAVSLEKTRPGQLCRLDPVSEEAGTQVFRSVPGRYRLVVQPGGHPPQRAFHSPITREIVLEDGKETTVACEAVAGGRVRLTVHLADGKSGATIPGLAVTLTGAPGEPAVELTRFSHEVADYGSLITNNPPSGAAFTCVRLLEPGAGTLTVRATGYAAVAVPILIRAGEITDAEVRLAR